MGFLTKHLKSVNETYFQHLREALSYAVILFIATFACFIHAIFPFLFEKVASNMMLKIQERLNKRVGL
jgi:hypothetical protein